MCGRLRSLLDCFLETGMDGIDSVTPPPVGDTDYVTVREKFGDSFTIAGRYNAQLWVGKTSEQILKDLKEMIPRSLIFTPFYLKITTDQLTIHYDDVISLLRALETYNRLEGIHLPTTSCYE